MTGTALLILGAALAGQTETTSTAPGQARIEATETSSIAAEETLADGSFVKGEFITVGALRVVPKRSFAGVRLGALLQENTLFLAVAPRLDLILLDRRLRIGLEVPLNFELYSIRSAADAGTGGGGFDNAGRLRKRDYDEARDFVKFLSYFVYGRKEDAVYLAAGQQHNVTLGHGQAMRRYAANVDVNQTRVGVELDAYGPYGGFELSLADVTRATLFGVLGFVKPLSLFTSEDNWAARSVSIGFSYATDQKAPWALLRNPAVGNATVGSVVVDEFNAPQASTRSVNLFGVDAEVKVVKTDSVDLKTYVDFSKLDAGGSGLTLGALGRFNFRSGDTLHLLRTRLEIRSYQANFIPSYFDAAYEFQKFLFIPVGGLAGPDVQTKLQYVLGRGDERRFGVYLEATYSLPGWLVFAVALETDSVGQDRHLMIHAEVPLRYLDIFATYHQRNFTSLFRLDDNDLIFAGARLQILPILFLNGRVQKSFEWNSAAFDGLGSYAENFNYQVDAEFGFQF
jgi:hypothetical protein